MDSKTLELDENPRLAFEKIYKKAVDLGLKAEDLQKLDSLQFVKISKPTSWSKIFLFQILILIPIFLLGTYFREWPIAHKDLAKALVYFTKKNIDSDTCLLKFDDSPAISATFRQVEKCDFCRGVTKEARLTNLSPKDFEEKYVKTKHPLVVLDGAKNWTAREEFNFDFFRKIYVDMRRKSCWFHPYSSGFKTLVEALEMDSERAAMKPGTKPWYFGWSNCDILAAAEFRKLYSRPYFLPKTSEMSKTDWFFMGSIGYGANLHVDNVKALSWQAQVVGTKVWSIKPPRECAFECASSNIDITVNPGEIIILDADYWYHATMIIGDELSICVGSEFD